MGLDYSLCAAFHRSETHSLLFELSTLLMPGSQQRIAHLVWAPRSESRRPTLIGTTETDALGIAALDLNEYERENSYCFALKVQLEPEMKVHLKDPGIECFDRAGAFGCLWTSIIAGSKYLFLRMVAATSGMSRVLEYSQAIHDMWSRFAQGSNAIVAYVDLEDSAPIKLYPDTENLVLPDHDTLSFEEDGHICADLLVEYIRRFNKL